MESQSIEADEEKKLVYKSFCQIYTWNQTLWVEKGRGPIKIIKKADDQLEVIIRQNTNNQVVTKFLIERSPLCEIVQHAGNDRA